MKQLFTLSLLLFLAVSAFAQLPNGSTAPNFTSKDINGRTWDLYSILESGRPVVMDVSATWCGPCWSYHNSHAIRTLYDTYGPSGTSQVFALMVEGDASTNLACLYGPSGCVGGTTGNWVNGTTYPIIDDASIANAYDIAYFPTIYLICPNKTVKEIGQINATGLWNQCSTCLGDIPQHFASMAGFDPGTIGTELCGTQTGTPKATLMNLGSEPLTEAVVELRWNGEVLQTKTFTGNAIAFDLVDVEFDPVIVSGAGMMSAEVVSVNGNPNAQSASASVEFTAPPQKYAAQQLQLRIRTDAGGKDLFWAMYDNTGTMVDHGGNEAVGINGGGQYPNGAPDHPTAYANNTTIRDTLTVPAGGCFTFKMVDAVGNGLVYPGYYRLYELGSSTQFFTAPPSWGSSNTNAFAEITSSVNEEPIGIFVEDVYPNPVTDQINIEFGLNESANVRPVITDLAGKVVFADAMVKMAAGEQMITLPVRQLANGFYFLQLQTDLGTVTRKFVVAK